MQLPSLYLLMIRSKSSLFFVRNLSAMLSGKIALASALLLSIVSCAPLASEQWVANSPSFSLAPSLLDISITELTALLNDSIITSRDLVQLYLDRIAEVNDELHAVLEISDTALRVAAQRDRERHAGLIRGNLHGIPIIVKDNYATTDGMLTGAGSVCLAKSLPSIEATVVAKLRAAGAIIIGKANLAEFSGGRGNSTTTGWSPRGNQTYGAYVKHQTACGSSSGSGVSASLGLAAGTLGTETAGSITCPAFVNNVVGIKPTVGLTSRFGVVPLTARQDTTGPIVQSVADGALMLEIMAGKDERDNYTLAQPWEKPPRYMDALNMSALVGKRVGAVFWAETAFGNINHSFALNRAHIDKVFSVALDDLRAAGANVIEVELGIKGIPFANSTMELRESFSYQKPDFAEGMARYMSDLMPDLETPHTVAELLECIKTDPAEFGDEVDYSSIESIAQTNKTAGSCESWEAYSKATALSRRLLTEPMEELGLDAIVTIMTTAIVLASAPGLPIITVPMGSLPPEAETVWNPEDKLIEGAPGFPLGLSFVADQWSEFELLGMAYAYEQVSKKRGALRPHVVPTKDLEEIMRGWREDL